MMIMQMNRQRASRNTKKNEKKIEQGIAVELMIDIRRQEREKREKIIPVNKKKSPLNAAYAILSSF